MNKIGKTFRRVKMSNLNAQGHKDDSPSLDLDLFVVLCRVQQPGSY